MGVAGAVWATILSQFLSALFSLLVGLKKFQILHLRREDFHGLRKTMILYQDTIYGLHDRTGDANSGNCGISQNNRIYGSLYCKSHGMVWSMCVADTVLLPDDEEAAICRVESFVIYSDAIKYEITQKGMKVPC